MIYAWLNIFTFFLLIDCSRKDEYIYLFSHHQPFIFAGLFSQHDTFSTLLVIYWRLIDSSSGSILNGISLSLSCSNRRSLDLTKQYKKTTLQHCPVCYEHKQLPVPPCWFSNGSICVFTHFASLSLLSILYKPMEWNLKVQTALLMWCQSSFTYHWYLDNGVYTAVKALASKFTHSQLSHNSCKCCDPRKSVSL